MTITNGYATLAEYKNWIASRGQAGVVGTDATDDTVIESIVEMASRYIDRMTNRKFYLSSADETRYYKSLSNSHVSIDGFGALTSVSVDYDGTKNYTALVAITDYETLPVNAALDGLPFTGLEIGYYSSNYFPAFGRGIKVIGKIGFPAIPADIKTACLAIAQSVYGARSGQSSQGKVTVTAAGVVIRPEDVPAMAQKIIDYWRWLS